MSPFKVFAVISIATAPKRANCANNLVENHYGKWVSLSMLSHAMIYTQCFYTTCLLESSPNFAEYAAHCTKDFRYRFFATWLSCHPILHGHRASYILSLGGSSWCLPSRTTSKSFPFFVFAVLWPAWLKVLFVCSITNAHVMETILWLIFSPLCHGAHPTWCILCFLTAFSRLCTANVEMGIVVCLFEYVLSNFHQEGARMCPSHPCDDWGAEYLCWSCQCGKLHWCHFTAYCL
jgi:hypothetical protein